jgi:hypothetical protein
LQPQNKASEDHSKRRYLEWARTMNIKELQRKVIEFRDARDWAQFLNGKD